MKKLFFLLATTVLLFTACKEYDDSELMGRVDNLEERVSKLETLCSQMNTNISSLQTLVSALQKNDYITSITPVTEGDATIGYTITFTKSTPITIYHGKDGKDGADGKDGVDGKDGTDGKDGYTPVIGVRQDTDGIYYWTLDGGWLLDEVGNKIKAVGTDGKDGIDGKDGVDGTDGKDGQNGQNGADGTNGTDGKDGVDGKDGQDGITPQLKIEDDYWYVSYDNGATWVQLGKATDEDGKDGANGTDDNAFFQDVDVSNQDYVIFTLIDGSTLQLPTWYSFEQLKTLCNEMNKNISSLQSLLAAIESRDCVTSCTPYMENGLQLGYTISFAKGNSIIIYHGKDGADGKDGVDGKDGTDGKDGYTPVIGVRQDTDGIYYWTLDGGWLLDEVGNKIKAVGTDGKDGIDGKDGVDGTDGKDGQNGQNGADGTNGTDGKDGVDGKDGQDGITPQLKIEDDYWYVSYDNGATWVQLGKATGEDGKDGANGTDGTDGANGKDGDSFFQSVTQDENNVYFTLADGTVITLPKGLALGIAFDEADLVVMSPNSTRSIGYTVTSATEPVVVEVTSSADIKAKVVADNENGLTGKIEIMTGTTIDEYSKVIVFVSNGDKVIMRSITFEEAGIKIEDNATKEATAEGGEVTLEFLSNVECEVVIPEDAQSWISVVPVTTRAMEKQSITLKVEPNDGAARSAEVIVKSIDGNMSVSYTISQAPTKEFQLQREREALIAIYNALDGDNWINNENWCSDKPVGEWYGVEVEGDYVSLLFFPVANNFNGCIPEDIKDLDHLYKIYFHDNGVEGNVPEELFYPKNLQSVTIISDNASVTLPSRELPNLTALTLMCDKVFLPDSFDKFPNLQSLEIRGSIGEIPTSIGECKSLEYLSITNSDITLIPSTISQLTQLKQVDLSWNKLTGSFPAALLALNNLELFRIHDNLLSGPIPKEVSAMMDNLEVLGNCPPMSFDLSNNNFTGQIPSEIYKHPNWKYVWHQFYYENSFDFFNVEIPCPDIVGSDIYGNFVDLEKLQQEKPYTILYQYPIDWGTSEMLFPNLKSVKSIYDKFSDKLNFIFWGEEHSTDKEIESFIDDIGAKDWIVCRTSCWDPLKQKPTDEKTITVNMSSCYPTNIYPVLCVVNNDGYIISTSLKDFRTVEQMNAFFDSLLGGSEEGYVSTDYSSDGELRTLQNATKGKGIDVVLMGDAYSDRQIADGTYEADMANLYNSLFTEEPYRSFKDFFNVYYVNAVSENEGYGTYNETAFSGYLGEGILAGGDDAAAFRYARKAISSERVDEALIVVAMNTEEYAGTCYMYNPENNKGYGNGVSVSYFPKGNNAEAFAQLLHHEACGHGFAKLADEYAYEDMGTAPSDYVSQIQEQQANWGWWKNVDFTNDPTAVRWSRFLSDERYQNEGLGMYEGSLTYWNGVWRPTENSIMRYNTGGFNAPSREAIYCRIHKLAYGDSWEYDYEEFVEWDAKNRKAEADAAHAPYRKDIDRNFVPLHPPVVKNMSWRDAK